MLTDYFSCYIYETYPQKKVHPPSPKLKECQIFIVIKVLGYSNIGVPYF